MSDEHILEEIYSTHVHSDTKFDVESLFNIAGNILMRSTHVVDNVVQGHQGGLEQDSTYPPASFTSPLCTLKQINSEMSCKPPGEEIAYKTTLSILNKLSNYSWFAKGVLTLSAFALEFGEFWLLSQYLPTEPLAKSLAIIKRVPQLTKPEAIRKHHNAILELNNLIKASWQVIDIIIELERLNSHHDIKEVPALAPALEQFPVDVYWVIITIAAIVTQLECLTTDSDKRQDLSQFDEAEYNKLLKKLFQTPTKIMEVCKIKWKEEKSVIIYGGKDKEWIQQFSKFAGAIANDATIKQSKTSIDLFCLESQQPNVVNNFWKKVEGLFVTKMHEKTNTVTQQVEKLLSYKNETGWAIVTKGSIVTSVGHGTTVLKTVAEFDKWKDVVITKGFEFAFREHHQKVASTVHLCSHLEIPNVAGKIPDFIECPDCNHTMEVFISYKCCHNGD
ncbi:hypothetical protein P8452_02917 [Trifolium repens]|nr:hypothetical protein P8452_02917 [Trifolium repens]